jgi:hypothetical protein
LSPQRDLFVAAIKFIDSQYSLKLKKKNIALWRSPMNSDPKIILTTPSSEQYLIKNKQREDLN